MPELLRWTCQFLQDPFDRTRPLWQYVVVDGLEHGLGALITRLHHTVADGQAAVRLAEGYVTLTRDGPEPPDTDLDRVIRQQPEQREGLAPDTMALVSAALRWPVGMARRSVDWAVHPDHLRAAGTQVADLVHSAADQLHPAGSSLWGNRSRGRCLEIVSVSFHDAHRAARALGGTLNDFFMAGATEAAHRYHAANGVEAQRFHVTFVVSTRTAESGQNAFSPVPVELPGGPMDLIERFNSVRAALAQRRQEVHGEGPMGTIAGFANLVPTAWVTSLIRSQARHIDFATSNLPAFTGDTYVAGGRTLHCYVFGPVAGTAFNLTLLSVAGSLDIGIHIDAAAVAAPSLLRTSLEDSYRDLIAAGQR